MAFMNGKSNKAETIEHFMCKMMVYKVLLENNHQVQIERHVSGVGVMDVFDYTTGVIYEIEPVKNQEKTMQKWNQYNVVDGVKDLVIVPYKQILKEVGFDKEILSRSVLLAWRKKVDEHVQLQ